MAAACKEHKLMLRNDVVIICEVENNINTKQHIYKQRSAFQKVDRHAAKLQAQLGRYS